MGFYAKISKMRSWRVLVLIRVASLRSPDKHTPASKNGTNCLHQENLYLIKKISKKSILFSENATKRHLKWGFARQSPLLNPPFLYDAVILLVAFSHLFNDFCADFTHIAALIPTFEVVKQQ